MLEIIPLKKSLNAQITIQGAKNYSLRALFCACYAEGESVIKNSYIAEDLNYVVSALRLFGNEIEHEPPLPPLRGEGLWSVRGGGTLLHLATAVESGRVFARGLRSGYGGTIKIIGRGNKPQNPNQVIDIGGSGVGMRFLTSYAALAPGEKIITGNDRMKERPIGELLNCLKQLGVDCHSKNNNNCPPIIIKSQGIKGGECEMLGETSSQFFSSICLAAPYAKRDVVIKVKRSTPPCPPLRGGELQKARGEELQRTRGGGNIGMTSKAHFAATLDTMKNFGIEVEFPIPPFVMGGAKGGEIIKIKAGQKYQCREYEVEGDWPSASYFFGLAAITGGTVKVYGLNADSLQGEKCFLTALEKMGCEVKTQKSKLKSYIEVIGPKKLTGIEFNDNNLTDAAQTLMVVAAFAKGKTVIKNLANSKLKESDRIGDMAWELKKIGCEVEELNDGLIINGGLEKLHGAEIETYNDHRTAMSFALAGAKITGVKIKNPECVGKSYVRFWKDLERVGISYVDNS